MTFYLLQSIEASQYFAIGKINNYTTDVISSHPNLKRCYPEVALSGNTLKATV